MVALMWWLARVYGRQPEGRWKLAGGSSEPRCGMRYEIGRSRVAERAARAQRWQSAHGVGPRAGRRAVRARREEADRSFAIDTRVRSQLALSRVATALAALSVGALAVGALAVGKLAIGSLRLGRGRIARLRIEDLEVGRLRIRELITEEEIRD